MPDVLTLAESFSNAKWQHNKHEQEHKIFLLPCTSSPYFKMDASLVWDSLNLRSSEALIVPLNPAPHTATGPWVTWCWLMPGSEACPVHSRHARSTCCCRKPISWLDTWMRWEGYEGRQIRVQRSHTRRDRARILHWAWGYHGAAILNFSHWYQCNQTEAGWTKWSGSYSQNDY